MTDVIMLCGSCQQVKDLADPRPGHELRSLPGWDRLEIILCARCGNLLPRPDSTDRLLDTLSRLARAGLTSGTTPILEP